MPFYAPKEQPCDREWAEFDGFHSIPCSVKVSHLTAYNLFPFYKRGFSLTWICWKIPHSFKEGNFLLWNLLSVGQMKIWLCEEQHCSSLCRCMMGPLFILVLLKHTVVQTLLLLHPLAVRWQSSSSQIRLWLEKAFFWSGMQWMLLLLHSPLLEVGFQWVAQLQVIQPVIHSTLLKELQTNFPTRESSSF